MAKHPFLKFCVKEYRKRVSRNLFDRAKGVVVRGGFSGMRLNKKVHWGKGDLAAKIYGLYEPEILQVISASSLQYLVNLGAGDGYYPIGMLIHKKVEHAFCFEENQKGRKLILENSKENNVQDDITLFGRAEAGFHRSLPAEVLNGRTLVLCDIEGGEFDVFTPEVVSAFKNSTFIIELHDWKFENRHEKREALLRQFDGFNVRVLKSKPKQWAGIGEIEELSENDRALVCSEGRKFLGEWIICDSK
jgi:hypothetical protein